LPQPDAHGHHDAVLLSARLTDCVPLLCGSQFLNRICPQMVGMAKNCRAVSLIKVPSPPLRRAPA
jgi:hypothetical protein